MITPEIPGPISYSIANWTVTAENITVDREGLLIKNNKLTVFSNIIINIPHLRYYPDGSIKLGGAAFEGFVYTLGGFTLGVTDIVLSKDGLNIKSYVSLPEVFGGFSIYFDKLTLHPGGGITSDVMVPGFDFNVQGFHFLFKNIGFTDAGFSIEEGVITLPASLGSKQLRMHNFAIRSDGSFDLGGAQLDPFTLWGYVFHISNAGFHDGIVSFAGSIQFPGDFFLEGLAGITIDIDTFEIMLDGTVKDFKVKVDEELFFDILDVFTIVVDTISVDKNILIIEEARLELPPDITLDSVSVQGIRVDVETWEIDYGTITISGVPVEFLGCSFYLETLAISEERGLEFTGNVTLPYDLPILSSVVLDVGMFQITPALEIGDITATVSGINTSIFDFFELNNGSIGLIKTGEVFELSCSGQLEVGWNFPEGIAGRILTIHECAYDFYQMKLTAFRAGLSGFSCKLFNQIWLEDGSILLALIPDTGDLSITTSGVLVLPDDFPGCFSGARLGIHQFEFTTAGQISVFDASFGFSGTRNLFDSLQLTDGEIRTRYENGETTFSVAGEIVFGPGFPAGLSGKSITIEHLTINTKGDIIDCTIACNLEDDTELFGTVLVRGGRMVISKSGDNDLAFSLVEKEPPTGEGVQLILSDIFPEGIRGTTLTLYECTIQSGGTITAFHAELENLFSFDLFGITTVEVSSFSMILDEEEHTITVNIGGNLILSGLFPGGLRGRPVALQEFTFNTAGDITAFRAQLDLTGEDVDLFAGIILRDGILTAELIDNEVIFDVGGSLVFSSAFPIDMGDTSINFTSMKFDAQGNIIDCSINTTISDLSLFGTITVVSGTIDIVHSGTGAADISMSGLLRLTNAFPGGLAGQYLTLEEFTFSSDGTIHSFHAYSGTLSFSLFGLVDVRDAVVTMDYNQAAETYDIEMTGNLYLGSAFPQGLRQEPIRVNTFSMDTSGKIHAVDADLTLSMDRTLFGGIILKKDSTVHAYLQDDIIYFDVNGTAVLSDAFPKGIAGIEVSCDMTFDQTGKVKDCSMDFYLTDQKLFGILGFRDGLIRIYTPTEDAGDMQVTVQGSLILPDFFPEGLAGEEIVIHDFTIGTDGSIKTLDAGVQDLNVPLFGVINIENGAISATNRGNTGLIATITGEIVIPETLPVPKGLKGLRLGIDTLVLSSESGLLDFRASLVNTVSFELFAGITVSFTRLTLDEEGFALKGDLTFPPSFPEGLANKEIELKNFEMAWDGTIKDINAGIRVINITLAGFNVLIQGLSVTEDCVEIDYATLTLPSILGGNTVAIENAGFDYKGNFYGDFMIPELSFTIAGLSLVMYKPDLDVPGKRITFERVVMKLPEALGGIEFTLEGVKVSPTGLDVAGGEFDLPDFCIAGGLGFRDVGVKFVIAGGEYSIEGQGSVIVPGIGELSVWVGFANISDVYPWGVKYARMEFRTTGLGIPIPPTPFFINGIQGAIAFGPPGEEMPERLREMFGPKGTRIMLGLMMRDQSGDFNGGLEVWVNIDNWDWAVYGYCSMLSGKIHAEAFASVTQKYGFYAELYVELKFIQGAAYIHIWDEDGRGYICGGIAASLKIPELILVVWPTKEIWFGGLGVEFGDFTNGKRGFKLFYNFPVVGETGIYLTLSGDFNIGNVSQYELIDGGIDNLDMSTTAMDSPFYRTTGGVQRRDAYPGIEKHDTYYFTIPGNEPAVPGPGNTRSETGNGFEKKSERVIFFIEYTEGDPFVIVTSPSGTQYTEHTPGVESMRTAAGMMFAVLDPEPGRWTIDVTNLTGDEAYDITVWGKLSAPAVICNTPAYAGEHASGQYEITGTVTASAGVIPTVYIYCAKDKNSHAGQLVGETTALPDGTFSYTLNTQAMADGEYHVFAHCFDGEIESPRVYAPGSIKINNSHIPLAAPEHLVVTVNENTQAEILFTGPFGNENGRRCMGFNLYVENLETQTVEKILLGYVTNTTLSGLEAGASYTFAVSAYDAAGIESPRSAPVTITMEKQTGIINDFTIPENNITIDYESGTPYNGTLAYTVRNPETTGSAYDYMDVEIIEVPEHLCILFDTYSWDLTNGTGQITYSIHEDQPLPRGGYTLLLHFRNMGNRDLSEQVIFTIHITHPDPVINSITPEEWNSSDEITLEVHGENFIQGTTLFLDDNELVLDKATETYLCSEALKDVPAGDHIITVTGPSGNSVEATVTVTGPSYVVVGYKTSLEIERGAGGTAIFGIKGENGFTGTAHVTVRDIPAGWTGILDMSIISEGDYATLTISIPGNEPAESAVLSIVSDNQAVLPVEVQVVDEISGPHISSLSVSSGFPGDEIYIFGYGFTSTGEAFLGTTPLPAVTWQDDRIKVQIPHNTESGDITVRTADGTSNSVYFVVKSVGFTLYPAKETVYAQRGDTAHVSLLVAGYADQVHITAESVDLILTLQTDTVTPNATVRLTIQVPESLKNGTYPVIITGSSGNYEKITGFDVAVGDTFIITTGELPAGMEEVQYRASIQTENGTHPVQFSITNGNLPHGLTLSADGTISGRPYEAGTSAFTVTAADGENRKASMSYTITISENAWSQPEKDSGRSRYNPVGIPADNSILWQSRPVDNPCELLTGKGRIFMRTAGAIYGINKLNGRIMWKYEARIIMWAYANERLYILEDNNRFTALDSASGNPWWTKEHVLHFTTDGSTLYLGKADETAKTDMETGTLQAVFPILLPVNGIYIWQNGTLFHAAGSTIRRFEPDGWQAVFDAGAQIADISADEANILVLVQGGKLMLLDQFMIAAETETGVYTGETAFGEERLYIISDSGITGYDRQTLDVICDAHENANAYALGKEKLVLAGDTGLAILNGYTGNRIWNSEGAYNDAVIAGEEIYALGADGVVECYNAPANIWYPETVIQITPDQPDGNRGYYIALPEVELTAEDPESYVAGTYYKTGTGEWQEYTGPLTMPEGEYPFAAYSIDNHGYREPDVIINLGIDTTPPHTGIIIEGTKGEGIYYTSPVTLQLIPEDNVSGIHTTTYTLDGVTGIYSVPLQFEEQGTHTITWYSEDRAGNLEQVHTLEFGIDLHDPVVEAFDRTEPGLSVIYISAHDDYSGINRIDYRVDDGGLITYTDPVVITEPGPHAVAYHAVDHAGRDTGWRLLTVETPEFTTGDWVTDLKFAYPAPGREYVRNIQEGDRLYSPCRGRWNRIAALPEYLVGADYIRTHVADKLYPWKNFITFTANADIDVFIMKHKESAADLTGWTLVEEHFPVEPKVFFKGGADIYMKSYRKGEAASIPGTDTKRGWGNLVFIRYARDNYIKIISPVPGKDLAPDTKERYCGVILGLDYAHLKWERQIGEGDWEDLGVRISGEMDIPFVQETTRLTLKLSLYDEQGSLIAHQVQAYEIVNNFEIILINPGPGTEVLTGEDVVLSFAAKDMHGNAIQGDDVSWAVSYAGTSYTPLPGSYFRAPDTPGRVYLKAGAASAPGVIQHAYFVLDAVTEYSPLTFWFGEQDGENTCMGKPYSMHESGRWYGFNRDCSDRIRTFKVLVPHKGFVEMKAIQLDHDSVFEYGSGNGIFLVKMTISTGKQYRRRYDRNRRNSRCQYDKSITIEGNRIVIPDKYPGWTKTYEKVVVVEDGKLTLAGGEDLLLVSLEVRKLTPEEAAGYKEKPPCTWPPRGGPRGGRPQDGDDNDDENDGKGGRK